MAELLLHPTTNHQLEALVRAKPHAVLIVGGTGMGKQTLARQLASRSLNQQNAASLPQLLEITPDPSIGIEQVRTVKEFLRRKTAGTDAIRRVVLLVGTQSMTPEAQNALLKTLEEPPADTMIILTADDLTAVRPTIRSRSQQLQVLPVSQEAAETYFKSAGHKLPAIQSAYYMSEGRSGLMTALLDESDEHELVSAITQAKELLQASSYERLLTVDALSKQKETLPILLQGLERVVVSGLRRSADKQDEAATRRFYALSTQIQQAQNRLAKNTNAKAVLTDLFLNL